MRRTSLYLTAVCLGFILSCAYSLATAASVASSAGHVVVVGSPMPLPAYLRALGAQSGRSVLVLPGTSSELVDMQWDRVPFDTAWGAVLAAYGLESCRSAAVLAVGKRPGLDPVCASLGVPLAVVPDAEPVAESGPSLFTLGATGDRADPRTLLAAFTPLDSTADRADPRTSTPVAALPDVPTIPARYGVRVRILELADNSSSAGGVDWSNGLLGGLLGAGVSALTGGTFVPSVLTNSVSALESRGLARKLDDVRLVLVEGKSTAFRSGGTLQLSLVGAGSANIERQLSYGLTLSVTPTAQPDGSVALDVAADLSSPVSVSNPALLDLSTRSVAGSPLVRPGAGVLLAAFASVRNEESGQGLPGAAGVPVVGWLAGRASSSAGRSTVVVTLELERAA